MRFFVGLDLAKQSDFTAVTVLEVRPDGVLCLESLERIRGMTYPRIVSSVVRLTQRLDALAGRPSFEAFRGIHLGLPALCVALDCTGVGEVVTDLFREAKDLKGLLAPVVITAGVAFTQDAQGRLHVPKKDLVEAARVALQTGHLKLPRIVDKATGQDMRDVLIRELESFQVKVNTQTAHESFAAWREGVNDDCVLSLSLAVWAALHPPEFTVDRQIAWPMQERRPWEARDADGRGKEPQRFRSHLQEAARDLPDLRRFLDGEDPPDVWR
jgi:hypothetical protein